MKNELIDVTNALIFALKIDGRKDIANTELIAEAERIVKLCNLHFVSKRSELLIICPECNENEIHPVYLRCDECDMKYNK